MFIVPKKDNIVSILLDIKFILVRICDFYQSLKMYMVFSQNYQYNYMRQQYLLNAV